VMLGIALVAFVMLVNLRGVKESGFVLAVPTFFFVAMMGLTVGTAIVRHLLGTLKPLADPPPLDVEPVGAIGLFLVLHAFSSGTTALTGVEAISNGITAFKEPRSRNAGLTLIAMSIILGTLFLGISYLSVHIHAVPSEVETVISQLAETVYNGQGLAYLLVIASTTLILIMAANTAYADFPRLGALHAGDGFLPRQLTFKGSRLVYSRGIVALGLIASLLIIVFRASVTALIPLYAIGVFLSFTLSQTGMARRWWKCGHLKPGEVIHEPGSTLTYDPRWQIKLGINGVGAVATAIVMLVFAITKFRDGAWIIVLLVPTLVTIFYAIHHHYKELAASLSLDMYGAPPYMPRQRVILPISGVHQGTMTALRYARTLSKDVTAVHVSIDPADTEKIERKWAMWGDGVRLIILDSPYRQFMEPLLQYIDKVDAQRQPNEVITIVVPEFVPRKRWHHLLHTQAAINLRLALRSKPGIVVTDVPYQVIRSDRGSVDSAT